MNAATADERPGAAAKGPAPRGPAVIPSVRYDAWQPFPGRPGMRGLLVRFLTCTACNATLARQFTGDPADPPAPSWPWPHGTDIRAGLVPLAGVSPRGLPRYGLLMRVRRGKRARPIVHREQVVRIDASTIDPGTGRGVPDARSERLARLGRPALSTVRAAMLPRRPDRDEIMPGDPPIYFSQPARGLPCEVYCLNCGRLHLLPAHGPEGAPPADLDDAGPETVSDP